MEFDKNIPLRHGNGLVVRTCSGGRFEITCGKGWSRTGPHTLLVLAAFATPRNMTDALKWLAPHLGNRRVAMELMDTILSLFRQQALIPAGGNTAVAQDACRDMYGSAPIHIAMLDDNARTLAWLEGVRSVVRPGDVVVEVGTGTGLLAIAAAQAGARRVYAIEATNIADAAERMVRANGVAERVQVVRGWSTQVELPEQGDVFVSEMLGNDPFSENVLEITADAAQRLVRPNARFVPSRVRLWATLAEVPQEEVSGRIFAPAQLNRLGELYGQDFRALGAAMGPVTFYAKRKVVARWKLVSKPALLVDVSLGADVPMYVEGDAELASLGAESWNSIVLHFESEVGPDKWISTDAARLDAAVHWKLPVHLLPHPRTLDAGQVVRVRYRYDGVQTIHVDP